MSFESFFAAQSVFLWSAFGIAFIMGAALTMKVQYYRMVYEEEAGFISALVATLADPHLLPNALRKLDKV